MDYSLNFLAILVAGIANMVIGFVWYGPVFGKVWVKLMGFSDEYLKEAKAKGMVASYILAFVGALASSYIIACFLQIWLAFDYRDAFTVIFWPWLGFIATSALSQVIWEGRPWKLYFLNTSYYLVAFYTQALILVYWM
jgi:hypothetical protein